MTEYCMPVSRKVLLRYVIISEITGNASILCGGVTCAVICRLAEMRFFGVSFFLYWNESVYLQIFRSQILH